MRAQNEISGKKGVEQVNQLETKRSVGTLHFNGRGGRGAGPTELDHIIIIINAILLLSSSSLTCWCKSPCRHTDYAPTIWIHMTMTILLYWPMGRRKANKWSTQIKWRAISHSTRWITHIYNVVHHIRIECNTGRFSRSRIIYFFIHGFFLLLIFSVLSVWARVCTGWKNKTKQSSRLCNRLNKCARAEETTHTYIYISWKFKMENLHNNRRRV